MAVCADPPRVPYLYAPHVVPLRTTRGALTHHPWCLLTSLVSLVVLCCPCRRHGVYGAFGVAGARRSQPQHGQPGHRRRRRRRSVSFPPCNERGLPVYSPHPMGRVTIASLPGHHTDGAHECPAAYVGLHSGPGRTGAPCRLWTHGTAATRGAFQHAAGGVGGWADWQSRGGSDPCQGGAGGRAMAVLLTSGRVVLVDCAPLLQRKRPAITWSFAYAAPPHMFPRNAPSLTGPSPSLRRVTHSLPASLGTSLQLLWATPEHLLVLHHRRNVRWAAVALVHVDAAAQHAKVPSRFWTAAAHGCSQRSPMARCQKRAVHRSSTPCPCPAAWWRGPGVDG